jgi:hypothetical protein
VYARRQKADDETVTTVIPSLADLETMTVG